MEYVQEKDDKGKTVIRKVGLQPVQRDGLEYEFDVVGDLDADNNLIISKTRCPALAGRIFPKAGSEVADLLTTWLCEGAPPVEALITTLREVRGQLQSVGGAVPELTVAQVRVMTVPELEAEIERTGSLLAQARSTKQAAWVE